MSDYNSDQKKQARLQRPSDLTQSAEEQADNKDRQGLTGMDFLEICQTVVIMVVIGLLIGLLGVTMVHVFT